MEFAVLTKRRFISAWSAWHSLVAGTFIGIGAMLVLGSHGIFSTGNTPNTDRRAIPGESELVIRKALLAYRDRALAERRLEEVARVHGELAAEAVQRARAAYDAWMALQHPITKLFPESTRKSQWNYRNVAADFFCFQLVTGLYTEAPDIGVVFETLSSETALNTNSPLPLPRWVESGNIIYSSSEHPWFGSRGPLFGASEYAKDGLLSLFEATGDQRAYARMREIINSIIAASAEPSPFGPLPSRESEVNGEMLQTLSRMARSEADPMYAVMLARIAEASVLMLEANGGLASKAFDYMSRKPDSRVVTLRDHGNEAIVGLAEAFAFAVDHRSDPEWQERASRWASSLATMFERAFSGGIRKDGLMRNAFRSDTLVATDDGVNDAWGYIGTAALLFANRAQSFGGLDVDRLSGIEDSVRRLAKAVASTNRIRWEGASHDGYADTLESAMLVSAYDARSALSLLPWVDEQVGVMFAMQRPTGFVSEGYLDGNFMRTSLMYADLRSGGWTLSPLEHASRVGYAADESAEVLWLQGVPGSTGILRHRSKDRGFRDAFELPTPRLNSWPDWCAARDISDVVSDTNGTVEPLADGTYRITFPVDGTLLLTIKRRQQVGSAD